MVDVQERALSAFEKDFAPLFDGVVEVHHGVADERAQKFSGFVAGGEGAFEVHGFNPVGGEDRVVLADTLGEFLGENFWKEKVGNAESGTSDLVPVGWTDSPFGGADFRVAASDLFGFVEFSVVGQDQVCGVADQ